MELAWLKEWANSGFAIGFGIFCCVILWRIVSKVGAYSAPKIAAIVEGHIGFMNSMKDNQVKQTELETRQIEMLGAVDTKVGKIAETQEEHGKRLWRIENNQTGKAGGPS